MSQIMKTLRNTKRHIFRKGLRHLPVLDEETKVIKLLTNNDHLNKDSYLILLLLWQEELGVTSSKQIIVQSQC